MASEQDHGYVLVADDLDEGGEEALRQARAIGEGASSAACHAVPAPAPVDALLARLGAGVAPPDTALHQARLALASRVERLLGRRDVELRVAAGSPHEVILAEAQRLPARTIVMGPSRKPAATQWLLGSTADAVVRRAEVPASVARPSPRAGVVVVATDLSDPSLVAVQAGAREAARRKAQLVLVHALDIAHPVLGAIEPSVVMDDESRAQLRAAAIEVLTAQLQRFGAEGRAEVAEGPPQRVVPDMARRLGAELVVVATHGRSGLARAFFGSVAAAIVARAPCSVLVAR